MLEFHIVFVFDNKSEEEHHKLSVSVFYHKGLNLVLATGLFLHGVLEPAIAPGRVTFAGKLRRAGRGRSLGGVGPAGGGGARPSRGDKTGLDDPSRRTRAEADDGGWKVRFWGRGGERSRAPSPALGDLGRSMRPRAAGPGPLPSRDWGVWRVREGRAHPAPASAPRDGEIRRPSPRSRPVASWRFLCIRPTRRGERARFPKHPQFRGPCPPFSWEYLFRNLNLKGSSCSLGKRNRIAP